MNDETHAEFHGVNDPIVLLTPEQVCEMLGVPATWLGKEAREGRIPHIRLGKKKHLRFRPEQIEAYLLSRTMPLIEEDGGQT